MFPLLTLVGSVPVKLATGTNLIHILIDSAISTVSHSRAGSVDSKSGFYLGLAGIARGGIGSIPAALIGSHFSRKAPVRILRLALLSLLIIIFFMVGFETLFS